MSHEAAPGNAEARGSRESAEEKARQRRSETARVLYQRYRSGGGADAAYSASRARRRSPIAGFGHPSTSGKEPVASRGLQPDERDSAAASKGSAEEVWVPPAGIYRSKTGARQSRWDPQPLGSIISQESRRRGWDQTLQVASVTGDWEEIVGPHIAQHCPIESFEGGTLVARADSTAWAQQLQVLLPHIHRRIDERVGGGVVDKVIVRGPSAPSWTKGKRVYRGGRGPRDTYG